MKHIRTNVASVLALGTIACAANAPPGASAGASTYTYTLDQLARSAADVDTTPVLRVVGSGADTSYLTGISGIRLVPGGGVFVALQLFRRPGAADTPAGGLPPAGTVIVTESRVYDASGALRWRNSQRPATPRTQPSSRIQLVSPVIGDTVWGWAGALWAFPVRGGPAHLADERTARGLPTGVFGDREILWQERPLTGTSRDSAGRTWVELDTLILYRQSANRMQLTELPVPLSRSFVRRSGSALPAPTVSGGRITMPPLPTPADMAGGHGQSAPGTTSGSPR